MRDSAFLNVIGGADRGKQYELVLPETRIGRGADQDLVLADIAVSRRHITIHAEGGRFRLRDLGSGNGTLLNGARVDTQIMNDGDQIELGNTLMRFEHAASRAAAPGAPPYAPVAAPPPYAAPAAAPVYSGAVSAYQPSVSATQAPIAPYPTDQGFTPSDAVERPPLSGAAALPPILQPLASPSVRLATLGAMGALCVIALVVIVAKSALARPQILPSPSEDLYRQGLKMFAAKDYEGAKVSFNEALTAAPDSPEAKRYVGQCDVEVHARGAMQAADRALAAHRYTEAMRSLGSIEAESLLHDQAVKERKDNAPRAAQEEVEEARGLLQDDPDTAKARIVQALEFDPFNAEARQLAGKLHVDIPMLPAGVLPPAPPPAPVAVAPAPKHPHVVKDDSELAPVKVKPIKDASAGKVEAPSSGVAQAAYRNHDFVNAERLYRIEASKQPLKQMDKTLAYANQVRDLRLLVEKASADESKNPTQSLKEYQDALATDGRIGRGVNGSYFKQHIGKLQIPLAQQAFAQGHYDQAFAAVQQAQKLGAGDGGVMAKLEAKAQELTNKGAALQKTNLPQAKQYWRQVLKMVPSGSPTYNKAYTLVNNSGGAHRDEDED